MAVQYVGIDGEKVSREWSVVLNDMRAQDVNFNVNEGHRTFVRQMELFNLFKSGRGNLAAFPSPTAPHIRTARIDHAIDFSNDGVVFPWLASHGLSPNREVAGESWHIAVPADRLRAYAREHGGDPVIRPFYSKPFRPNPKEAVRKLQRLLRESGFLSVAVNGKYDLATRRAVGRFQLKKGLKVDRVVGPGTWKKLRS
jgi:hypothetical protein